MDPMLFQQCPIAEDGFLGMRVNSDRDLQAAPAAQTLQEGSTRCVGAAARGQGPLASPPTPRRLHRPSSHRNVQQPDAAGGANIAVADAISAFGGRRWILREQDAQSATIVPSGLVRSAG